ncbi:hypothetical protein [Streptomyces sp. B8F3]|uniref:TolB family protein n=1 Tax=unclassified Streptomyces TaxID=2593676 RepID=UPI00325D514B
MRPRHAALALALVVATSLALGGSATADETTGEGRIVALDYTEEPQLLVALDPTTGTVTDTRALPRNAGSGALSPDGSQLIYIQLRDECIPQHEGCRYVRDLWIADADGGNARVLVEGTTETPDEAVWAPDGKHVLFRTERLEWIAPDGTGREVLDNTRGHDASFSPDGKSLAFMRTTCWYEGDYKECGRDPYVMHLASREVRALTTDHRGGESTPADWSADSQRIVYSTGYGLRSVDVTTGASLSLPLPVYAFTPVFSPDGSRIAFAGLDDATYTKKVYVTDAAPGADVTVLNDRLMNLKDWLPE